MLAYYKYFCQSYEHYLQIKFPHFPVSAFHQLIEDMCQVYPGWRCYQFGGIQTINNPITSEENGICVIADYQLTRIVQCKVKNIRFIPTSEF